MLPCKESMLNLCMQQMDPIKAQQVIQTFDMENSEAVAEIIFVQKFFESELLPIIYVTIENYPAAVCGEVSIKEKAKIYLHVSNDKDTVYAQKSDYKRGFGRNQRNDRQKKSNELRLLVTTNKRNHTGQPQRPTTTLSTFIDLLLRWP